MSVPRRSWRRRWRALVAPVALGLSGAVFAAHAQTSVRVYVTAGDIETGLRNRCVATTHATTGAVGTSDTAYVYVVKDAASPTPVLEPKHRKLLISAGALVQRTLDDGKAGDTTAVAPSGLTNATISVGRQGDTVPLCAGLPAGARPNVTLDSLTVRRMREDSARVLGARGIRQITGRSFVILSLIKSIAGEIPQDEFFDLRLKFGGAAVQRDAFREVACPRAGLDSGIVTRLRRRDDAIERVCGVMEHSWLRSMMAKDRYFTAASVDVSLTTRADTTKADSTRRRLTDAGLSLNWIAVGDTGITATRMWFASARYKIFNTKSFVGGGIGGLELAGSRLEGTHLTLSYLYRVYDDSLRLTNDTIAVQQVPVPGTSATRPDTTKVPATFDRDLTPHHAFLEFYVRVPGAQFLDRLRIRGGILFPLQRRRRPEARIVLSVPVVDLDRF